MSLLSWFLTKALAVSCTEVVSGKGSTLSISGSLTVTAPVVTSFTSFQIPMFLPRTVGIQSQPMVAWKVGLSAPRIPPLKSVLCLFFSLMAPMWLFLMISTASTFVPGFKSEVTSRFPRIKAPSISPAFFPFRYTWAFQLMPSKFRNTFSFLKLSGTVNSFRYQKLELKNDSEMFSWLSA